MKSGTVLNQFRLLKNHSDFCLKNRLGKNEAEDEAEKAIMILQWGPDER